ncbi:MAG: helix-turn-helix domain-containing protein [Chloroflexi bacterium]|nr:helix-turn-helix domain-containing protein [Chloroflexota bacterium]
MKTDTCYCRNVHCQFYGFSGQRARLVFHDWHDGAPRFRCAQCNSLVGARAGTAYAGIRTDECTYGSGVTNLAEGSSIRTTGRLLGLDKDTVCHWLPRLGEHCNGVMNYFFRNLHLSECQLDELWTFVYKKEDQLDPVDKLFSTYGDAWVWIAFSPVCKLVPAWVVGKRTLPTARKLVFRLKSATYAHIPFFTSDELPHYADALLSVYGEIKTPLRCGTRGRWPKPRKYPPPELCYAVVVKERERGRVVSVTTRIVYGSEAQIRSALQDSPVSTTINTYGVERNNLTVRQHSRRLGRKVNAFSKDRDYLEHQLTLAFAYYHFVVPHRGLRERLPKPIPTKGPNATYKKWKQVTPAMAAQLTDHIWTMDELLSFRVPPKRVW